MIVVVCIIIFLFLLLLRLSLSKPSNYAAFNFYSSLLFRYNVGIFIVIIINNFLGNDCSGITISAFSLPVITAVR